jgi:Flp pilus assembly protein TadD
MAGSLALVMGGCSMIMPDVGKGSLNAGTENQLSEADSIVRVADATRERGDLATAAALYRRAHEVDPQQTDTLLRLGSTLSQTGNSAEAAEAFRRVLRIDSNNTEALRGLGMTMLQRNQVDLAIQHFQSALALEEDVRLYNALGVGYDMKGDHQAAQAYYRVGLQVEPNNLSVRSNYGLSLALSGAYDEAISVLGSLASDPMAGPQHRQVLAMAYGLAGNEEAAAQTARIDLGEDAVAQNLRLYNSLRALQMNEAKGDPAE